MRPLLFSLIIFQFLSCGEEQKNSAVVKVDSVSKPGIVQTKKDTSAKSLLENNLKYSIIKERKEFTLENDSIKNIIDAWLNKNSNFNIDSLVNFSLELTKSMLTFSFAKCESDPDKLVKTKQANCIGYAAFFGAIVNYAFSQKKLDKQFHCVNHVGKIYLNGVNINSLFKDPFFKDHDFNVIRNAKGENEIVIDPSLYDYLGIKRISLKE